MPIDLISVPIRDTQASAPCPLLACPSDLRALGRLDADGALLLLVETRDTDAAGVPLSTVSVFWNRYRGEVISCATGAIDAPPAHIEFARRAHTAVVLALCASAAGALAVSGGLIGELVALDGWGHG